jgi:hypothetical protein
VCAQGLEGKSDREIAPVENVYDSTTIYIGRRYTNAVKDMGTNFSLLEYFCRYCHRAFVSTNVQSGGLHDPGLGTTTSIDPLNIFARCDSGRLTMIQIVDTPWHFLPAQKDVHVTGLKF